jgi:hypothetical protein
MNELFRTRSICASATQLRENLKAHSVDLAVFSAGSISHLTGEGEIAGFLKQLHEMLKPSTGRAVISILKEFLRDKQSSELGQSHGEIGDSDGLVCLDSLEKPRVKYVKHPTASRWNGDVRMDRFYLQVESEDEKTSQRLDLEWTIKMIRLENWQSMLQTNKFEVCQTIEGDIQFWWVLRRAD